MSFPHLRGLKRHIKDVHKKYHPCDICGKNYKEAWDLKKHIKTIHEGKAI